MSTTYSPLPMSSQPSIPARVPNPPEMPVWLYILLCVITVGIFPLIWGFRVSAWMRRIDSRSHATTWWAVGALMLILLGGFYILALIGSTEDINAGKFDADDEAALRLFEALPKLSGIPFLVALYSARSSLVKYFNSVEPIGLKINGVLLFFLQSIYLQYALNKVISCRGSSAGALLPGPDLQQRNTAVAAPKAAGALGLQIAGQRHQLTSGGTFTAAQIPGLTSITASGVVAQVSPNPADPTVIGLKNQSQQTWHVTLPGGEAAQIASGQTIRLTPGTQFWFGQIAGVVV